MRNWKLYVCLAILLAFIIIPYVNKRNDAKELEKFGVVTKAEIYATYPHTKNHRMRYRFFVDGQEYSERFKNPSAKRRLGDSITIIYSSRNPEINRVKTE